VLTFDSLSTDNAQAAATCFEDVAGVSQCTDLLVLDRDIELERAPSVNGKRKKTLSNVLDQKFFQLTISWPRLPYTTREWVFCLDPIDAFVIPSTGFKSSWQAVRIAPGDMLVMRTKEDCNNGTGPSISNPESVISYHDYCMISRD
jgi:hypothetical protein